MADPRDPREGAVEPGTPDARLTREMPDPTMTSAHAAHDTMLVASLADHSLDASERAAAEALVASCGLCAALHADLLALRAATRAMPTPARPRDFRLTREDAERARPTGWRRWVAAFGTSRDVVSRPLAMGLTTLGLVGLLAASLPSVLMTGGATSLPAADMSTGGATTNPPVRLEGGGSEVTGVQDPGAPAGAPATDNLGPAFAASGKPVPVNASPNALQGDRASPAPGQGGAVAGPTLGTSNSGGGSTKGSGRDGGGSGDGGSVAAVGSPGVPPLVLLSASLLIVGLGLFAVRWGARRFGD